MGVRIAYGLAAGAIVGSACWIALKDKRVTAVGGLISLAATFIMHK